MGVKTGIEWCDSTWSPIRARVKMDAPAIARAKGYTSLVQIAMKMRGHVGQHCEHISPGCEHCYAETMQGRCLPANGTGLPYDRRSRDLVDVFVDEKALLLPLKWSVVRDRVSAKTRPRRIFVENQSDLFGDWVTDEMLDRVFAVMALCPQHAFQVLTKRPERMLNYLSEKDKAFELMDEQIEMVDWNHSPKATVDAVDKALKRVGEKTSCGRGPLSGKEEFCYMPKIDAWPLPNVWLGVSVENQQAANDRIPLLLQTPAAVRYVSCEPLLGPVNLTEIRYRDDDVDCLWNALTAYHEVLNSNSMDIIATADDGVTKLDWVICGGESGPGARPMHPDWACGLRDQCAAARAPFFFKQWGEWRPIDLWVPSEKAPLQIAIRLDGRGVPMDVNPDDVGGRRMMRVGKHAAGALLDGKEYKQFPEVRA